MKNFLIQFFVVFLLYTISLQDENQKVSFADYFDWDMEDRKHLGEQITKLDSLNGEIQTARTKVQLQYENTMNIIDQYLAELKHKYKQKEMDMIKDYYGFQIGSDEVIQKRKELKEQLKNKLRKLADQNQKLRDTQPQRKDVNTQIEEYKQKTEEAKNKIEEIEKQLQEALAKRKEQANKLKQDRLDHFDNLRKIRDSEAIASDTLKDIMKSQKHMMGGPLTQIEFQHKRKPNLLRKGKAWIDGKIDLNQRAEIHNLQQKFKRRNQKEYNGFKFGESKKDKVLKNLHNKVKESVKKAFEDFKTSFIL